MDTQALEKLREGVGRFNRGHYFEAHESLEEAWIGERGADREFLHGLIHLAVGLYHLDSWNLDGARSQLEKGLASLAPFGDAHAGLDLTELRAGIEACLARIPPGIDRPDFAGLRPPRIRVL